MKSLQKFLNMFREQFEKYEREGMELTDCDTYTLDKRRARRPTRTFEEDREENTPVRMSASEKFKLDTFFVIIYKLSTALELRINAYSKVHQSFGFLTEFHNMDHGQIDDAILNLVLSYPADFDSAFCTEFHQFTTFISEQENLITPEQHPSQLDYREVQNMYTLIKSSGLDSAFPNVEVALRIYLSLIITNCSGERSFSHLKRVKNEIRSTMLQDRVSNLSLCTLKVNCCEILISMILYVASLQGNLEKSQLFS